MSVTFERMIAFENDAFIIMDKPAGWLSVAGRGAKTAQCLLHHMTEVRGTQFWPIHRLDQPVSGLLMYAKTAPAHRLASGWFEGQTISKTYEALTEGEKLPEVGSRFHWSHKLLRGKKRAYEHAIGKVAITDAMFVGKHPIDPKLEKSALWRLEPRTGRSHQLRYQLSKAGFPIWGDTLYGSQNSIAEGGIALRATVLNFSKITEEKLGLPPQVESSGILEWFTTTDRITIAISS